MQSRRIEEFDTQSPIAPRVRDRRMDLGPEPYLMRRSPQPRRSLSPRRVEVSHKLLGGGNRRSSSLERSDYVWDLGPNRAGRVRSRSPPVGPVQKRPHYDEGVTSRELPPAEGYRRYETSDYDAGYENDYAYKQRGTAKAIREEIDGGRLDVAGHRMLVQKSMVPEDGTSGGVYRLPEDLGPPSKYVDYGGKFSSPPVNLALGGRFKDDRIPYSDPSVLNKLSDMDTYEKGEKHMFHPTASASMGTSHQFKDFTGTSSGNSRVNIAGPIRVGMPLPSDEQPRSSGKLQETLNLSGYGQRLDPRHEAELKDLATLHRLDPRHEAALKDLALHRRDTFSPTRAERRDYLYARLEERERDDYRYPSDEIYRRLPLPERVDYEFDHKDLRRPNMVDPVTERVQNIEFSRRNPSSSILWDHPYLERKTVSNNIGMSRSSASKQGVLQYLDPASAHIDLGRKMLKEQQLPYLGESHDHEILHMGLDYGLERDTGLVSRKERIRRSPEFQYETERLAVKTHSTKAEELGMYEQSDRMKKAEALGMYEQSDRMFKRKYAMVEEMERHDPRTIVSSKWINSGRPQDRNPRDEEWIDQDASGLVLCKRLGYDHELNRRAERTFDREDRHRGHVSRDGMSFDDPAEHLEERSNKQYKPVGRNIKGHSRPVYLNWHNSYQSDRRHVFPKQNNVWIRGKDDNQVDQPAIEVERSEPPEDSEEFKQLVQKYFLTFTKKLNDNPIVRKRYKEDGRAGSLFCIVCGRSMSKEFMDTKRLVNHAFMSHKVGLKAQHLGLQKAICVLLSWSSVVPTDVVTWTPDIISTAEASAQKEDLILWPPVIVIHNTSLPDHHDPQGQSNITIEALEDFLRGKGLSGGKVRFGKPGHHSIMLVKFLGTFSGLQDAEKLHSYFADNKRGRRDFEQIGSSKCKSKEEEKIEGDKVDELLLYGYMGIAEDLDKVDFDTKRKCSVKSKKEIQDLVDAPVKPE